MLHGRAVRRLDYGRGEGGKTQAGRKGAANRTIRPGETVVLADVAGPGVERRIWLTVPGRVETLRGWVVRVYWDGQDWPSVEAPLQDFFGLPFARQAPFESALFSNPEGRSFNCFGSVSQIRALPKELWLELVRNHQGFEPPATPTPAGEAAWESFETPQDVCATAYWCQTLPSPRWPALEPYAERVKDLALPPKP